MKFTVEAVIASGGRIGRISHTGKNGNMKTLETPLCTLFTKGGSAPYLSLDMLSKIDSVPEIATMSINTLAEQSDNIKVFGKGLGEFTAMKDQIVFNTLHDASVEVPSGKNTKSGVAVWSKKGKTQLEPHLYMKIQEAFQPDWFQALSDGDTDESSARKRLAKAVNRTLDFLDDIVELLAKSEALKHSSLIGVIEGGFDESERKRSAVETSSRPVHGFLIEGFQKSATEEDIFTNKLFLPILSKTISYLPEDKPRIMDVCWSPQQVLQAFKQGIDIFSSSYPHTLTEKGQALAMDFSLPPTSADGKLETEMVSSQPQRDLCIDLNDQRYFEDFSPIVPGCKCYACANFTRSYLHHLLNTSELLANVLLTIHNFHKYFEFFNLLRDAAKSNRLKDLEDLLGLKAEESAEIS